MIVRDFVSSCFLDFRETMYRKKRVVVVMPALHFTPAFVSMADLRV